MLKSPIYDTRIFKCGTHLLVLDDELDGPLTVPCGDQPFLSRLLSDAGAWAVAHSAQTTHRTDDVRSSLRERAAVTASQWSVAQDWAVLTSEASSPQYPSSIPNSPLSSALWTISGHQPAYQPYMGYLAKIAAADLFSIADDMRFGSQTFQHRQRIPGKEAETWMTVPLDHDRGSGGVSISRKRIAKGRNWRETHLSAIGRRYGAQPFFSLYFSGVVTIYENEWILLSDFTDALTRYLANAFGLETLVMIKPPFDYSGLRRGARIAAELVELARNRGEAHVRYLTGAAGARYLLERTADHSAREIDFILNASVSVSTCEFEVEKMRDIGLRPGEPAFGVLCVVGQQARSFLGDHTKIKPLERPT